MKRSEAMCLNKKIKNGMKNSQPTNIGRLDKSGFEYMHNELNNKELSLLTFESLVDIYKIDYKFIFTVKYNNKMVIKTIDKNDSLWAEVDKLYYDFTNKHVDSANKCYREIVELFSKINGTIIFE